jgi:hypothetical protein
MDHLIIFLILVVVLMMFFAFHIDHGLSIHTFFTYKGHLNRAVHAASLQIDKNAFANGIIQIDPIKAREAFDQYIKTNMNLDDNLNPIKGPINGNVEVLEFIIYNGPFPSDGSGVEYTIPEYNFKTTLYRPGVIAIVKVDYKELFNVLKDVKWNLNASHELTY